MFSWLQQSGDNEETQSEEYDFEYTAVDFLKLLFLALISSCVSFPNILYSLGPTDKDIEMADGGPTIIAGETAVGVSSKEHADKDLDVTVSVGEAVVGMPIKEHAGKGPDVTVTIREAIAGVPSQRHVVSSTVHDVHQSKELSELQSGSSSAAVKRVNLEEFLEQFAKDKENE
nr:hypothetical protein CFP56_54050 [Quercus suber]